MDKLNKNQIGDAMYLRSADTLSELVDYSNLIIQGKVISFEAIEEDHLIFTYETIEVKKVIKGNVSKGDKIIVSVTGGELDGKITPPIQNFPIMDMRDNYMLFLEELTIPNYYAIVAGNQGFGKIKNGKIDVTADNDLAKEIKELEDPENEIEKIMKEK